ncbi:MAG: hypothetical protein OXF01_03810, partial [Gemmatimonadetes bacterium]|nr:hypothetical protein [Gemmatimonadota bacterium]
MAARTRNRVFTPSSRLRIGMGKIGFLEEEFGAAGVAAARGGEAGVGPPGVMNPGEGVGGASLPEWL